MLRRFRRLQRYLRRTDFHEFQRSSLRPASATMWLRRKQIFICRSPTKVMRSDREFTAWVAEAKKKYAGNEE